MEREHTAIGDILFFEFIIPTYGAFGFEKFKRDTGFVFGQIQELAFADETDAKKLYTRNVCEILAHIFNTTVEFWENLRDM